LFFVKKIKKLVNYEIDLFKNAKIFLIFYILLLKLTNLITSLQDTFYFYLQEKEQFEIKEILRQKN